MEETKGLSKGRSAVFLAIIIILQLALTCYYFIFVKQATFSDEPWSYGVANGYYHGFIFLEPGVDNGGQLDENVINWREWVDDEVFHDYITVQKGERFAYDSVYSNSKNDIHPPLYFFLLHTICSFFPEKFSYWYSFSLNLICLVLTQIFLFKLSKSIMKNEKAALIACMMYAATTGALSTFLLMRMYALITFLTVMFTYYTSQQYNCIAEGNSSTWKNKLLIALSAFLLFFSNYSIIVYVGVLTFCVCVFMLIKKKFKEMFVYGFSVLLSLVLFICCYPVMISKIIERNPSTIDASFSDSVFKIRIFFALVLQRSIGIKISVYQSSTDDIILGALVALAILLSPLCFLFRKETWFKSLVGKIRKKLGTIPDTLKNKINYFPLFMMIASAVLCIMLAKMVLIMRMGYENSSRYIFMLMPIAVVAFISFLYMILGRIKKIKKYKNILIAVIAVADIVFIWIKYPVIFSKRHFGDYRDFSKLVKGENCLVVATDNKDPYYDAWEMVEYLGYIEGSDHVFFTPGRWIKEDIDKIKEREVRYVIVDVEKLIPDRPDIKNIDWIYKWLKEVAAEKALSDELFEKDDYAEELFDTTDSSGVNYDSLIRELNGGCDYDVLFGMDIQGSTKAVLELKPKA